MAKSSEEVEREVEATRGQIDRTVEALKEKMQPKELFDEATRVMGGASNKVMTTVVEQARENPIPIALIGAGVAWLALSQRRKRQGYDPYTGAGYYETYEGYDESGRGKLKAKVAGAVEAAKGAVTGAKSKLTEAVHQAKDGLDQTRAGAADGTAQARGRLGSAASAAQARAGQYGRQAQQRFQETLDTEPLILGAIGLAVGVAVGASLPTTRTESRYMGPHRDKLLGKGRDMAKSSLDEARAVAERAYGQVKGELHRQTGPEGEGTTLRDKAQALADAGKQSVHEDIGAAPH